MTDLSKQLVMTPQLQLAIRMLATPSGELATMIYDYALVTLAPGEADPADVAEEESSEIWRALDKSPFEDDRGDVFVFGNPPQVRANRSAYPRMRVDPSTSVASDRKRDAAWVVRALRQRARTQERVVAAIVAQQPRLAISIDGSDLDPIRPRDLATAIGMHESTVARVTSVMTIRNLHGVLAFEGSKKLLFRRVT